MVVIEPAKASDVQEIKQVLSQTWINTYGPFLSHTTIQKVTDVWHAPELLEAQVKNSDIFFRLAKDESGIILGLITAQQYDEDTLIVARLYVRPQSQRQGIGSKLLNDTMSIYSHAKKFQLAVEAQNEKGISFYRKQGFDEVGRSVEKIEGETLEVIHMEKNLT